MIQGRILAGLAALLLGLGSASAQSPQAYPSPTASCSPALPPAPSWNSSSPAAYGYAVPVGCYAPPPVSIQPGCTFSVTKEGNAVRLLIVGNDGLRSQCEKTTLLINGTAPVTISVEGKQVLVHNDTDVKGSADRVSRGGTDGATLTLEGNAEVRCWRNGRKAEMTGERIMVNLLTGHVEAEMGSPQPATTPAPTGPITPVTPVTSTSTTGTGNSAQPFSYGWGPFR